MSYPEWSDKPSEMVAMLRNAAMEAVLGQGGLVGQTLYARAADALQEEERLRREAQDLGQKISDERDRAERCVAILAEFVEWAHKRTGESIAIGSNDVEDLREDISDIHIMVGIALAKISS